MTDFKTTTWMSSWSEDDHKEYEAAWKVAKDKSDDTGIRAREWLRLVLEARQAKRQWATDVLADMQRRGALESWKAATVKPVVIYLHCWCVDDVAVVVGCPTHLPEGGAA